jgi:hypothetical protein
MLYLYNFDLFKSINNLPLYKESALFIVCVEIPVSYAEASFSRLATDENRQFTGVN